MENSLAPDTLTTPSQPIEKKNCWEEIRTLEICYPRIHLTDKFINWRKKKNETGDWWWDERCVFFYVSVEWCCYGKRMVRLTWLSQKVKLVFRSLWWIASVASIVYFWNLTCPRLAAGCKVGKGIPPNTFHFIFKNANDTTNDTYLCIAKYLEISSTLFHHRRRILAFSHLNRLYFVFLPTNFSRSLSHSFLWIVDPYIPFHIADAQVSSSEICARVS